MPETVNKKHELLLACSSSVTLSSGVALILYEVVSLVLTVSICMKRSPGLSFLDIVV
jgi:hypothetical protein